MQIALGKRCAQGEGAPIYFVTDTPFNLQSPITIADMILMALSGRHQTLYRDIRQIAPLKTQWDLCTNDLLLSYCAYPSRGYRGKSYSFGHLLRINSLIPCDFALPENKISIRAKVSVYYCWLVGTKH